MKKKYSIFEIKKYLNKKGFIVKKKIKIQDSGLNNLSRTFLSSLMIISFFFITPLAINLSKEKMIFSKDYENNSKNSLKKLVMHIVFYQIKIKNKFMINMAMKDCVVVGMRGMILIR